MRDPFPVVAKLGDRLGKERTGYRDMKAVVMVAALSGPPWEAWNAAAAIADGFGIDPDTQHAWFAEAYLGTYYRVSESGTTTKENPCPPEGSSLP